MEMINFDQNVLSDITNFFLVVLGLAVTIFTVIYSFIINKREELIKINAEISVGKSTPYLQQKRTFNLLYIKNYIRWNKILIGIGLISLFLFLISFINNRFICDEYLKKCLYNILVGLFIFTIIALIATLIWMFYDFKRNTKL